MNAVMDKYTVVRSRKRRTAVIQIRHEGVVVRVPTHVSDQWIAEWVGSKQRWIDNELSRLKQTTEIHGIRPESGFMPYMGENLELYWVYGQKQDVTIDQGVIKVILSKRSVKSDEEQLKNVLKKWYRHQAQSVIERRVAYWQTIMNLQSRSLTIRDYKRRWGSCSGQGDISLNWRLIFAEESLIDYVIIHELAHLVHLNHSQNFWRLVEKYCLDWSSKRKALHARVSWILW